MDVLLCFLTKRANTLPLKFLGTSLSELLLKLFGTSLSELLLKFFGTSLSELPLEFLSFRIICSLVVLRSASFVSSDSSHRNVGSSFQDSILALSLGDDELSVSKVWHRSLS